MSVDLSYKRDLSEDEFGRLFNKCRPLFVTVANSYVHDAAMSEDLVNDSFVRLWEKRDEIVTNNFEAYVFQTVVNKCLDYLKSEQTQTKIRQDIHNAKHRMLMYEINSLESCDPDKLFANEVETIFKKCIEQMPNVTREVFIANRFQNKTYQEIADEQGLSVRRVTSEIQSALHMLRFSLKDYLPAWALLLLLDK